jgi:hypothetical protein
MGKKVFFESLCMDGKVLFVIGMHWLTYLGHVNDV